MDPNLPLVTHDATRAKQPDDPARSSLRFSGFFGILSRAGGHRPYGTLATA
jgi:hypothetical protein